jgi:hypothetical protein
MKNRITISLIFLTICIGFCLNFSHYQNKVPKGCDEFGYLNLAKAFSENNAFSNTYEKPYFNQLIDTLRFEKFSELEFGFLLAPMSYYLKNKTYEVINMYNPGTSFVLSWFPINVRGYLFPLIAILIFSSVLFIYTKNNTPFNWADLLFIIVILLMFLPFSPIRTEYTRINSLALTFGILAIAGYFIPTKPIISIALIGLSANFRLGNLLILLPIIFFMKWPNKIDTVKFIVVSLISLLVLIVSISPYLLYSYKLFNNPFSSTYSEIDTAMGDKPFDNLRIYINFEQLWFVYHLLVSLILFYLTYIRKITILQCFSCISFAIINYVFYIFKNITMNYYPYASLFILIGICLYFLNTIEVSNKIHKIIKTVVIVSSLVILTFGFVEFKKFSYPNYIEQTKSYQSFLCKYEVIWGGDYTGTTQYICNNKGFMYVRGSNRARILSMKFLLNKKISQIILIDDISMPMGMIVEELINNKIPYSLKKNNILVNYLTLGNGF